MTQIVTLVAWRWASDAEAAAGFSIKSVGVAAMLVNATLAAYLLTGATHADARKDLWKLPTAWPWCLAGNKTHASMGDEVGLCNLHAVSPGNLEVFASRGFDFEGQSRDAIEPFVLN